MASDSASLQMTSLTTMVALKTIRGRIHRFRRLLVVAADAATAAVDGHVSGKVDGYNDGGDEGKHIILVG